MTDVIITPGIGTHADGPDIVTEAAAEIVDELGVLYGLLKEAHRAAPTPERALAGRILRDRIGATFRSVVQLIEKIEQRPVMIARARRVLAVADDAWICRELIRELGAQRIQDRQFDAELDEIYRAARARLQAITEAEQEATQWTSD